MSTDAIHHYYAQYDEWGRLETPSGKLEFQRCMRLLGEYLEPHSHILDLGGGPGRYTIALARRGHQMTLVDLSAKHVRQARRKLVEHDLLERVDTVEQRDARSVDGLADDSFDAVVAFGPFYHLVEADGRRQAAGEIARLVRDDGLVFVQYLPPVSGYVRLLERAAEDPEQVDEAAITRAVGERIFQNPSDSGFQEGYYADTAEISELFGAVGIEQVDAVSVRGIAAGREDKLVRLQEESPRLYEKIMDLVEETARLPEVIATGQIAVWVGRK